MWEKKIDFNVVFCKTLILGKYSKYLYNFIYLSQSFLLTVLFNIILYTHTYDFMKCDLNIISIWVSYDTSLAVKKKHRNEQEIKSWNYFVEIPGNKLNLVFASCYLSEPVYWLSTSPVYKMK